MIYTTSRIKTRKCKHCKEPFVKQRALQYVCSPLCGIEYSKSIRDKQQRKDKINGIEKLKTRTDHLSELQTIFNRYIRLRDRDKPCISCDTTNDIKYDAGHYFSVGHYPELRFNEDNCHKQCSKNCNTSKHGNLIEYRPRLIAKIGVERFEKLEALKGVRVNLSLPEIIELKTAYRLKIKGLLKQTA